MDKADKRTGNQGTSEADKPTGNQGTCEASSTETPRYPKRNIARKNYHESSDEETDPANFCFCEFNICHS